MSFNGSGVFVINSAGQPVVSSTLITAAAFNAFTADVATGLSNCVLKDGTQTVTANLALSGFKLTGLGDGTSKQDAATLANVVAGTGIYVATVGGTADAITLTASPAITAYAAGQTFRFIASGANTTAVTVAISGLAAKAITKNGATALAAGDIASGHMVTITYDGTRFILAATSMVNLTSPTITGGIITQVPITQNSQSTAYPTVLADGGKHLLHPTADNNARTFTIDGSLAYPVGTVITFVNQINVLTIAITTDTMTLAGTASSGSRTLAVNGIATAMKIASGVWIISGTGLA